MDMNRERKMYSDYQLWRGKLLRGSFSVIALLILSFGTLEAEGLRIPQVDPSQLLVRQRITAHVSITDSRGRPIRNLRQNQFQLSEYSDSQNEKNVPILDFAASGQDRSPVHFLLLLDNSGSMYARAGRQTRIMHARDATRGFLSQMDRKRDRVALASYHTRLKVHSDFTADTQELAQTLDEIVRPVGGEGYTELYASLNGAVEQIRTQKGRRVLIVLSDGENRPYYTHTGKPHVELGTRVVSYKEPLQQTQAEGVSVFVINYGSGFLRRDRRLAQIARETGGAVFDARNARELASVYSTIIDQVRGEYRITYRATMIPADQRYVRVVFTDPRGAHSAARYYFASNLFGLPLKELTPWLFLPLALALLLAALLYAKKFEKEEHEPTLEVFRAGARRPAGQTVALNEARTIIGGGANADLTISGNGERPRSEHATVLYDRTRNKYTVVAQGKMRVNNKRVSTKILNSGDVIDVNGTTIVFDDGSISS